MTAVIIVLIVICGVLAYNLYNINKENENLKISRLKYQKYLEELGYKEYDPYKYRDDDEVYGIQEYDIRPEVKIDGKVYDITNTEYFKNKVELFETRKRFKALIASSEFQSCFLRQIASHFEEQNLKKFNTYLYKEIGTRLGIDEEDSRKLYFEVMEIHPFYYGYSTSSDYSKENRLDDITEADLSIIRQEIIDNPDNSTDTSLKNVYLDFIKFIPHYRECAHSDLCDVDINLQEECQALRRKFDPSIWSGTDEELGDLFFPSKAKIKAMPEPFDWDLFLEKIGGIAGGPYPKLIESFTNDLRHKYSNGTLYIYPNNYTADRLFSSGRIARIALKLLGKNRKMIVKHLKDKD